jgi:hypothetical protein
MITKNAQSLGGYATGKIRKATSLKLYLENPSICLYCGKMILPKNGEKPCIAKSKKFCDHSCSAKYSNSRRIRNEKNRGGKTICVCCGNTKTRNSVCTVCQIEQKSQITKQEIFKNLKNWQTARSTIRKHATRVFERSTKQKICFICGYSNYIEICHIKAVSKFPETATLGEINAIENLVALCPNHHKELDNGILNL